MDETVCGAGVCWKGSVLDIKAVHYISLKEMFPTFWKMMVFWL